MPWYAWVVIGYCVADVFASVLMQGRSWEITPGVTVMTLITKGLLVWAVLALAGVV